MNSEYFGPNWKAHVMGLKSGNTAFHVFEDDEAEIFAIDGALTELVKSGILGNTHYDLDRFNAFRSAVEERFEIPWTGISPRMRRLIYSINAINRPDVVVCAGIFCGYTFICNAGAGTGPGACYEPTQFFGFEILEEEVLRAKRNIETIDTHNKATIICGDTAEWFVDSDAEVDLLYIDAKPVDWDRTWTRGLQHSEYYKIVNAAMRNLKKGALVLAHNSVNAADYLSDYLEFVRNEKHFRHSVNLVIDDAGLEVTIL